MHERTEFAGRLHEAIAYLLGDRGRLIVECPYTHRKFTLRARDAGMFEMDKVEFWAALHRVELTQFRKWLSWKASHFQCGAEKKDGDQCTFHCEATFDPAAFVAGVTDRCKRHGASRAPRRPHIKPHKARASEPTYPRLAGT